MKIQITSEREISFKDFWKWAEASILAVNLPIGTEVLKKSDFVTLLTEGEFSFETNINNVTAKTTYRIVEK